MRYSFPYEEKPSPLFSIIKRPIAELSLWPKLTQSWLRYKLLVDTGADYTVMPKYCSVDLGVDLTADCQITKTSGVGGTETIYFVKQKIRAKIGTNSFKIPLGFLPTDTVPPLLGREGCLNLFKLVFSNFLTEIYT